METLTLVFNYHQLSGKCQFIKLNNTFNKYLPSNDVKNVIFLTNFMKLNQYIVY